MLDIGFKLKKNKTKNHQNLTNWNNHKKENLVIDWLQDCIDKGQILCSGRNDQLPKNQEVVNDKKTTGLQKVFWGLQWIMFWKSANTPTLLWEKPAWNKQKLPVKEFASLTARSVVAIWNMNCSFKHWSKDANHFWEISLKIVIMNQRTKKHPQKTTNETNLSPYMKRKILKLVFNLWGEKPEGHRSSK